ncbi:MAG: hypothetical protein N3F06_03815, partial [Nitrososphaerales archaeon]|nr:hypothetical protein [Nitrososphaerales archaeon]
MKSAPLVIITIITFATILPISYVEGVFASNWIYNERLNITVLESDVFYEFVFTGGNVTSNLFSNVEKDPKIQGFKLIVSKLEGWSADYHLIRELDRLPPSGAILKVKAPSKVSADGVASLLDIIFNINLQSIESTIGEDYVYYSPIDFNAFVKKYLRILIPRSLEGYSLLLDEKTIISEKIGVITISADRSNVKFQYSVSVLGVKTDFIKEGVLDLS